MWKRGTLEGGERAAERCSACPGPFDFAQGRLRPGPTLDPDPHPNAQQTTPTPDLAPDKTFITLALQVLVTNVRCRCTKVTHIIFEHHPSSEEQRYSCMP